MNARGCRFDGPSQSWVSWCIGLRLALPCVVNGPGHESCDSCTQGTYDTSGDNLRSLEEVETESGQ